MSRRSCPSCGGRSADECSCFVCDVCSEVCSDPWTADPEVAPNDLRKFCLDCLDLTYPPEEEEATATQVRDAAAAALLAYPTEDLPS